MEILSLPRHRINWITSSFLIGTVLLTVTGLPVYLWFFGLTWFHVGMFFLFVWLTGFSITAGYHRLFAHKSYQAKWPLRLMVLLFGASAFENSAFSWVLRERRSIISRALEVPRLSNTALAKSASLASFDTKFGLPPE